MNDREKQIVQHFAKIYRDWSTSFSVNWGDDSGEYSEGYDSARHSAADTIDDIMRKQFGSVWEKAKEK